MYIYIYILFIYIYIYTHIYIHINGPTQGLSHLAIAAAQPQEVAQSSGSNAPAQDDSMIMSETTKHTAKSRPP